VVEISIWKYFSLCYSDAPYLGLLLHPVLLPLRIKLPVVLLHLVCTDHLLVKIHLAPSNAVPSRVISSRTATPPPPPLPHVAQC